MTGNNLERIKNRITIVDMPDDFVQLSDNRSSYTHNPAFLHDLASRRHNAKNPLFGHTYTERKRDEAVKISEVNNSDSIIKSDFQIPADSITIVGAAKSAKGLFYRIPSDSYRIGCNVAIMSNEVDYDCWMTLDDAMPSKAWFEEAIKKHKGTKIFRKQLQSPMEKAIEQYRNNGYEVHVSIGNKYTRYPTNLPNTYWMYTLESFPNKTIPPVKGEFRHGGTVVAFALQLGWYYGIKKFYLIGVEMRGNKYHVPIAKNPHHADNEIWDESVYLQTVINTMKADGCKIYTLSPTTLDIKYPDWIKRKVT
jgi:hypothetical protein